MRTSLFWLAVLAPAFLGMSGCSDSRCAPQICRTALMACHVEPPGMASVYCYRKTVPDPSFDTSSNCSAACNEANVGETIECLARRSADCLDAGSADTTGCIIAKRPPVLDRTCESACLAERDTCDSKCPTDSFAHCYDCSASCGLAHARCWRGCVRP